MLGKAQKRVDEATFYQDPLKHYDLEWFQNDNFLSKINKHSSKSLKMHSLFGMYHKDTRLSGSIPWLIQIVHSKILFIDTILLFLKKKSCLLRLI